MSDEQARKIGRDMASTIAKGLVLIDQVRKQSPDAFTHKEFTDWIALERARLRKLDPAERQVEILDGIASLMLDQ